ncbi:tetratricopeptide repeat protein [Gemmata sp. G18]|uniref:Tetratricopeptide repeat protein n=1 Tax=Gemmata palustris TaxID=2822762 RepID=A0ABS5BM85_9BACT|nr:tetratricopeptide repeat protein [Gemmata palustris]MBP3954824.1 tetratricopeptide repeat protein [Gemmata palustris]
MFRLAGRVLRLPGRAWKVIRRRPRLTVLFAVVLVTGAGFGLWRYALGEWRAAQAALKNDRPQEAQEYLAFCLRVWPQSLEVHLFAARAARLTGDLNAAEARLNRCIELQGGATEGVQLEFLLLRVQAGEVDELAPVLFDLVQKGHPESPIILETVAHAYILRLRYKPAFACLSLWIEKYPDGAKPYQWRGWALERLSNEKGAKADYHRALELNPDLMPVRLRVAEMFLEDKQAPEALPHLELLCRQAPNNAFVQARMGMCWFLQGRNDEARRLMEAAVPHLPFDPALLVSLANLDLQENKPADAEHRLRAVLKVDPSDTETLFVLASALHLQGRSAEAAVVLDDYKKKRVLVDRINELLKDKADSPTATAGDYAEIGQLFLQIGREKFGTYWLERALERDATNQVVHHALAVHYERKGDASAAAPHRRHLRTAVPVLPPSGSNPEGKGP